jgi:hypothetical protein
MSDLTKEVLEYYIIIFISINTFDNGTDLKKLKLFTKLPPHMFLSQVAMLTDLRSFLQRYFCTSMVG